MSAPKQLPAEAGLPERGLQPATPAAPPADDAAPLTGEDATLLDRIASASRNVRAVKAAFKENPAPALDDLVKVFHLLTFQVATKANKDDELLETTNTLIKTAIEAGKLAAKKADTALEERRVRLIEEKAAKADAAEEAARDVELSEEERRQRIKEIFGIA